MRLGGLNLKGKFPPTHHWSPSLLFPGASVAQVAIAWLLHQPSVVSVVIGARTLEQLEDNLQAVNVQLTKEEVGGL